MTREPAPVSRPVGLTIASSDSGGGAGIQADLKTMEACGAFGTSVIVATTAQNTRGVDSVHVLPIDEIDAQYAAITTDFDLGGVKTGMLATADVVETVTGYARDLDAPLVVDPVMVAASGDRLLEPEGENAYEDLVGEAALVTPNADECAVLTGTEPEDEVSAREAGEQLVEMGADAALIKGGHVPGETAMDVLVTGDGATVYEHPRVETDATHGSGCTLASAITARLAHDDTLDAAVEDGLALMERAIRYPLDVGKGPGAVHHYADLRNRAAREPTAETVAGVVEALVERDVSPLVPEVGMNVVGATPYAERVNETAAVEGRITRTLSGVNPNRGVRFGASSHVARFLLAAREFDSELRFAVNCRFDDDVEASLDALDWSVAKYDRSEEPEQVKAADEGTMGWGARQAFDRSETPAAVIDRGEVGKEAIVKLVAANGETLTERALSLLDVLENA
ncbi:bifunctional hydroxymethylpyrimidine kinase/phosphomethylpyrimidine kinase [Halococcus saccharolyticus]|uniref:Phosphomethylpyrimidine kinase n=1 Tax=Halococcus saccharolyticus DSM 5350 TaxID=1227455 RepID=M0MF78_9EURY|nr:bifunctional hydroxymethylpyrimidine kinase/phosphomethylpyrimidine kinase [Halococcus saccharolyticus]EMA43349.1 phosphomethylpyrimidine kinase [Halococcus saccharolyticus DSM 5350]